MPELDPLTGLPKPPVAPWLGSQGTVDDSVASNVAKLASKDSELNRMAATEGLKAANRRGLLNSSMAVSASQDSVLKNVMPIAQQDAAQAFAKNQAARAFEYGMTQQEQQQSFLGTEAGLNRSLEEALLNKQITSAEFQQFRQLASVEGIEAANRALQTSLQKSQQIFAGTQADLDRILQERLQSQQLSAADAQQIRQIAATGNLEAARNLLQERLQAAQLTAQERLQVGQQEFLRGERIGTQEFVTTQANLDRDLQALLQNNEINAAQANLVTEINSREGINAANNALQLLMQGNQQNWQTGERMGTQDFAMTQQSIENDLRLLMQNNEITFQQAQQVRQIASTEGINSANNFLQTQLQENAQIWETQERRESQTFVANQATLDRDLQQLMQTNAITSTEKTEAARIASAEGINAANNYLQEKLQLNEQTFATNENELNRMLEIKLQGNQLTATEENLIRQIYSTEGIEAANRDLQEILQQNEQRFATTENGLNRQLELAMQGNQITSEEKMFYDEIASREGIEQASRELQLDLQNKQNTWQTEERLGTQKFVATQAELDQKLQILLQGNQITSNEFMQLRQLGSTEGIEKANRDLQLILQNDQQQWATGERVGTQTFQAYENQLNRQHDVSQASLDRALELTLQAKSISSEERMQIKQIAATKSLNDADNALTKLLAEKDIAFRMSEGKLNRAQAMAMQNDEQAFNTAQNAAQRALDLKISNLQINATQRGALAQTTSNTMGWYQQQYQTIMNNPELSATQRTAFLKNAKDQFNANMRLNEKVFAVELGY